MYTVLLSLTFTLVGGAGFALGESDIQPLLKYIASADGKSFFTDSPLKTWENASIYCKSLGMELASITSRAQWEALDAAYNSVDFGDSKGAYWTSGRDRLSASQFIWEEPDVSLDESYLSFHKFHSTPLQCVAYSSKPGRNTSYLINEPCAFSQLVLCEANPNSNEIQEFVIKDTQ